jgi:hypothetical protein
MIVANQVNKTITITELKGGEGIMKKLSILLAVLLIFGMASQASALMIVLNDKDVPIGINDLDTEMSDSRGWYCDNYLDQMFKVDGDGEKEGYAKDDFDGSIDETEIEDYMAIITYVGSESITFAAGTNVIAKDGSKGGWWIWDVSGITLEKDDYFALENLWSGVQGTISNAQICGTSTSVPDASIMFLLGSSLLGLAVFGRKPKKS